MEDSRHSQESLSQVEEIYALYARLQTFEEEIAQSEASASPYVDTFKLEQALTELALFQKTPRYQAYAQRVEEIKNRKETALRALEEKGVVRIGQEIRILASPAISMEEVQNIRVDKAA